MLCMIFCASSISAAGSRNKGAAVVSMIFDSKVRISLTPTSIFCFLFAGPLVEGVGGTADRGVGGWGNVAEAGVRGTPADDCLRFPVFGSAVVA